MKRILAAVAAAALTLTLTACGGATSVDQIAIITGDGQGTHDANVHRVVYPGESVGSLTNETAYYVPGNSRNYVIDANNGDRKNLATALTSTKTPVAVSISAFWTLNQDPTVLKTKFFPFCRKYSCYGTSTTDTKSSSSGTSTAGWEKMLAENFSPAIDAAVRTVLPAYDDTTWSEQKNWDKIAAEVSGEFTRQIRQYTGFTDDLFCGSGDNSGWKGTPGADGSSYTCGPVTFKVTNIVSTNVQQQQSTSDAQAAEQQKATNGKVLDAAAAKYGSKELAGQVLAQQDVIAACHAAGQTCVVVLGQGTSVNVTPAK